MSAPLLLVLIGAALLAPSLVLYPLLVWAAGLSKRHEQPRALKPLTFEDCAVVIEPDIEPGADVGTQAAELRDAGFSVVRGPAVTEAAVLIYPGRRGRLTPGGVKRLLEPLADPVVGMSVGRLLPAPEEDETAGGPRAAALARLESLHQGLRRPLARCEARLGSPASILGDPCAVRAGFRSASPARTLRRLGVARQRVHYLRGRRALVGRRRPVADTAGLRRELVAETADTLANRGPHPGALVRRWAALVNGPALAALTVGAAWGAFLGLGLLFKLLVIPPAILAVGALVGRQTLEYGYRSRVYLPIYGLARELFLGTAALLHGGDVRRSDQ